MITLLDVIRDLDRLSSDLKEIAGTVMEKELATFVPIGEEQRKAAEPTKASPTTEPTEVNPQEAQKLLAEKSRAGYRNEVKALIASYGVAKFSEIPTDKLSEAA